MKKKKTGDVLNQMMLNVGSGQRPFAAPFINVDCQAKWNPDFIADGAQMPMFSDNTAEIIVLQHCLEHFNLGSADEMIKECLRILRPGGSLILTVPDLRRLAQRWLTRQITDYIFCVNVYGAFMGDPADTHKWGFSSESLLEYMNRFGFSSVKRFDWRNIAGADISADWWIAGAECIK